LQHPDIGRGGQSVERRGENAKGEWGANVAVTVVRANDAE
jgi:hypothetical protein